MADIDPAAPAPTTPAPATRDAELRWDDSRMATGFANVVNIQSTREQVDLLFGISQSAQTVTDGVLSIAVSNRMILSPFAAKRLSAALINVLREYESRYGVIQT
jgi:Protein of unknown function (DUF3467)